MVLQDRKKHLHTFSNICTHSALLVEIFAFLVIGLIFTMNTGAKNIDPKCPKVPVILLFWPIPDASFPSLLDNLWLSVQDVHNGKAGWG